MCYTEYLLIFGTEIMDDLQLIQETHLFIPSVKKD